jgi:hypothetical protein
MMHARKAMATVVLAAAMLVVATARAQTSRPAYPESEAGLKQFFQDILNASAAKDAERLLALTQSLVLPDPDAWFTETFGEKLGKKLAADYKAEHKNFGPAMARLFFSLDEPKKLEIKISVVQALDDGNAKGYQLIAIAAMQQPAALYTASITKEGTSAHITLWSIVYVDGRFRLAGKMRAIKDAESGKAE